MGDTNVPLAGTCVFETHHAMPCWRFTLPCSDSVLIAQQGAQVLSWVSQGQERLYLSPQSRWQAGTAIRGGVPICFPQFNQRGHLPKHGFARLMNWSLQENLTTITPEGIECVMQLESSPDTLPIWPHAFAVQLHIQLQPHTLKMTLVVRNLGSETLHFTGGLHTYLQFNDVHQLSIEGLNGLQEWNAIDDQIRTVDNLPLHIADAFDRVYSGHHQPVMVRSSSQPLLCIEQSSDFANTVVWNPGVKGCQQLVDMPADGHEHMLCIEAAQVLAPIAVLGQSSWQGWQRLSVPH
jgi:glucose-6-phosphate 1-epimerase